MRSPEIYMAAALELAKQAYDDKEAPVGCVVADSAGRIIGKGRNRREGSNDATAHAELEAIKEACGAAGDWRLAGCSLFVTLEPCPMCTGAIIMARIGNLYYGAKDPLTGSCGSIINLFMEPYGHKTRITGGILADECAALLSSFFKRLR